jgi:hypothetical protein
MGFKKGYTPWNKGKEGYRNAGSFSGGKPAWNKGLKGFRAAVKRPNAKMPKGETNHKWQGDAVKYRPLHTWVERQLGKPEQCSFCGKKGNGHRMHWANISGKYLRVVSDWMRLCPSCHKNYDKKRKLLD